MMFDSSGTLILSHAQKQQVVLSYIEKYRLKIIVETGTYYGGMVGGVMSSVDRVYSIELSETLFDQAVSRFKGVDNVVLICGDSGVELRRVMDKLDQPALFWLDGHYSGGVTAKGGKNTPIMAELGHVYRSSWPHVVLIDDARCFGRELDYPTVVELERFIRSVNNKVDFIIQDDIIRVTPNARISK